MSKFTSDKKNRYNKCNNLSVKTWNLGTIQGDICDIFWDNFCRSWINNKKISPYDKSQFDDFIKKNINSFLNYSNSVYNLKGIKKLTDKYSVDNIGRYFRKYYTIVEKILKDLIYNTNTIYFLQEINIPVIKILENCLNNLDKNKFSLNLLDIGSSYTTAIIFCSDIYSLEDKNVFNMNNYFGKTFITLFNVIWEQHSENTNSNEKNNVMESLNDKYTWIWKEFRYSCSNKSNENNILSILIRNKKTNKKLLCLNIHNPCWWIDDKKKVNIHENMFCEENNLDKSIQTFINDVNPRNYFDENILYILRNITIHSAINIMVNKIMDTDNLGIVLAGDFNIDGNLDSDTSNHLDGEILSSNIKILTDRLDRLNFDTRKLLNTRFNLINCHRSYYPSNTEEAGIVKIIVKDKEKRCKVEKDVEFFTQKSFNSKKILDRIYISKNLRVDDNKKVIEPLFCSDHVILSTYIK